MMLVVVQSELALGDVRLQGVVSVGQIRQGIKYLLNHDDISL
jgi:hypothetical protein